MKRVTIFFFLFFVVIILKSNNYIVTTTADNGAGSLRYALQMCMAAPGPHNITFNIPTTDPAYNAATGVWLIAPATTLPMIMQQNVTVDGTSQSENVGDTNPYGPEIVIDGGNTLDYGLRLMNAPNAVLKGLNVRRCTKGIQIYESAGCVISGCYIGTDETAMSAMGNDIGLELISHSHNALIGGNSLADRNIVSGNLHIGIRLLDVENCTVSGNFIGTNREGSAAIPNYDGMSMEGAVRFCTIGGTSPETRNLISGNTDYGLPLFGVGASHNVIIGNYIGTDATGTSAIGNTYGVLFDDGSFSNRVGGDTDAERNIISGNVGYGVFFYNNGTHDNVLKNNYIGTDFSGRQALPNTAGIIIDGISYQNWMDGNVVSGNLQVGIGINITGSDSNVVVRNKIGVNVDGNPLPNGMDGIRISQGPLQTVIGGTPDEANIIAHNGGCGVYITNESCKRHWISCNSFYQNGALAIDLFEPGVNQNDTGDSDDGANGKLNYPVINSVNFSDGELAVSGTLDAPNPATCEVQLYEADPDPTGLGEGKRYLGSVTPAANGSWNFNFSCGNALVITALTIDGEKNTSEFSRCIGVNGPVSIAENSSPVLKVWPNPTSGNVQISVNEFVMNGSPNAEVQLFDLSGRKMKSVPVSDSMLNIDLTNFAPGVYILFWTNGELRIEAGKIVVQ